MPNRASSTPNYQSNPYPERTTCYGCGEENHGLATCPKIEELLTRGELIRTRNGLVMLPGEIPLRRWLGQTLVSAYENWTRSAKTHFIKWTENACDDDSESESESEANTSENCWEDGYISNEETEQERMRAYPAYRTQREGAHKRTEIFNGVYPSKGWDAREEMKKEQHQRYELRGGRQYAPVSKLSKPLSEVPEKPTMPPPPKLMVPEAREFKLAEPKGNFESVRKPPGNPREENENVPLVEKEQREERRTEVIERNEPKKIWMREAHGIAPSVEKARYDAQDDVVVMEDDKLRKGKKIESVWKQGKDTLRHIPSNDPKAFKPLDQVVESKTGMR
jgi:hypothetical protein